jgi:NTE family protein
MILEARPRPPFDIIALVLQGGGALGAYQAGVYEALAATNLHPDWIAGISIGAINGALIAGNAPETRVAKLRAFWERVTTKPYCDWTDWVLPENGDAVRRWLNQMSAYSAFANGTPGFFTLRFPVPGCTRPAT